MRPARDKLESLVRLLSFTYCRFEKSLSTKEVLGNAVASPPQICRNAWNRPFRQSQASLKFYSKNDTGKLTYHVSIDASQLWIPKLFMIEIHHLRRQTK